jgi:hypothetical protein
MVNSSRDFAEVGMVRQDPRSVILVLSFPGERPNSSAKLL